MDENKINEMSYVWFQAVLSALGKRVNFESISNLYGNSFAKDSAKVIHAANPLLSSNAQQGAGVMSLMGQIKIVGAGDAKAQRKSAEQQLGDLSWAEGLFD